MRGLEAAARVLIIAPHPDDEVLGCGGTIARLADAGAEIHVVYMTRALPPDFSPSLADQALSAARRAHAMLGVAALHRLDFPAARMDTLPLAAINAKLGEVIGEIRPDTVFAPFIGDIHLDHQISFMSALVCSRPRHREAPELILAYETLSETNWYAPGITPAFLPNLYVDIEGYLDRKIDAFACFASEVRAFPDERSLEAIRALATLRGATVFRRAAEAFMLVRHVL